MAHSAQILFADVAQQYLFACGDAAHDGRAHAARAQQGDDGFVFVAVKNHDPVLLLFVHGNPCILWYDYCIFRSVGG